MNVRTIIGKAIVSGSIAGVMVTAALPLLAKAEGKAGARPINATSHWLHGDSAGRVARVDAAHTLVGYGTNHLSSIFWAVLFEALRSRDRNSGLPEIARDAAIVSATAAAIDYGLMPKRLTPGWELALPPRSLAAGFVCLAVGLVAGGLVTRR